MITVASIHPAITILDNSKQTKYFLGAVFSHLLSPTNDDHDILVMNSAAGPVALGKMRRPGACLQVLKVERSWLWTVDVERRKIPSHLSVSIRLGCCNWAFLTVDRQCQPWCADYADAGRCGYLSASLAWCIWQRSLPMVVTIWSEILRSLSCPIATALPQANMDTIKHPHSWKETPLPNHHVSGPC